jgi:cytochrome bd ubiquinol oxidase subunit II
VPLDGTGLFFIPLFTDFQPGARPGVFDWYTALVGVFTLCALAGHGALYLAWKTTGPVQARSRAWARRAWLTVLPLWLAVTLATAQLRPEIFTNLLAPPWFLGFVVLMLGGVGGVFHFLRRGRELAAFLSSSSFLLGLLAATMAGIYPIWLRSTIDPAHSLTAANSAAESYGLQVALVWWSIGMGLAGGYFVNLFRSVRGKVGSGAEDHGY